MLEKVKNFSVVDVETTGFGKFDKICEIAIVNLDPNTLEVIDEFETLVDPQRDIGAVHIHNITATMVSGAPTFEQIACGVAEQLNQSVLVAHNLAFDRRIIAQEFNQLGSTFDPGRGICTLNMAGEKLSVAADRYGIPMKNEHTALGDAHVAAEIFKLLFEEHECEVAPMHFGVINTPSQANLVVRGAVAQETALTQAADSNKFLIAQICDHIRFPTSEEDMLLYLDSLNAILADLTVDAAEQKEINNLMKVLDLNSNDIKWAHEVYLQTLIASAKRNGIITENEKHIMDTVAKILDVPHQKIPSITNEIPSSGYAGGTRICFTGTAIDSDNQPITRSYLEAESAKRDLQPVARVTKKGCDMLVAQDVLSQSEKAKKARHYDIDVVSVKDFLIEFDLWK